jgi:hypothetical protein
MGADHNRISEHLFWYLSILRWAHNARAKADEKPALPLGFKPAAAVSPVITVALAVGRSAGCVTDAQEDERMRFCLNASTSLRNASAYLIIRLIRETEHLADRRDSMDHTHIMINPFLLKCEIMLEFFDFGSRSGATRRSIRRFTGAAEH